MTEKNKTRTAIVTGGSSGIGFSIAQSMHKAGYKVAILGRDQNKLNQAVAEIGKNCKGYSNRL